MRFHRFGLSNIRQVFRSGCFLILSPSSRCLVPTLRLGYGTLSSYVVQLDEIRKSREEIDTHAGGYWTWPFCKPSNGGSMGTSWLGVVK